MSQNRTALQNQGFDVGVHVEHGSVLVQLHPSPPLPPPKLGFLHILGGDRKVLTKIALYLFVGFGTVAAVQPRKGFVDACTGFLHLGSCPANLKP